MIDTSLPEISARLACLERKLEALWRIVGTLAGAVLEAESRELSADESLEARTTGIEAVVATADQRRLRTAS